MLEDRAGGNSAASVFPTGGTFLPPFQAAVTMPSRERFYVELKPDETTVVSWKKLMKDVQKIGLSSTSEAPVGAHPALEARIAPEVAVSHEDALPPPPNRFNSVIEKIERLYKGGHSSDENENLSDVPDDDQYDTEDSFIDDEELNEYFSVDKAKTKHTGFFVNRGKLERENEPASSPVSGPKKRKRRDIKKLSSETTEDLSKKLLKSGVRMKAAARKVPLSTVGSPVSSDKTLIALAAPTKQTTQKERKDFRDPTPGSEAGKVREDSICESKAAELVSTVANDAIVLHNAKDLVRDASEGREVSKGVVMERSIDNLSSGNTAEFQATEKLDANVPLKRECVVQSEQKETGVTSLSKLKATQKGIKDDDSRETVGGGGKLFPGNVKSSPPTGKEVSPGRPKGTVLERAFQDLERGVAQLCPPSLVVREPEQGKRNRLPRDVKQKLAKVARLAAKQGRISEELIDRLMGILGHVMRVKTLKRNLKEMIENGLSAMQEKEGRLQDIKREVTEMVKSRVSSLQAQDVDQREGSSDDFQPIPGSAEKASIGCRYQWDHATEDRISDLYEQYIEGMDEHRGPQIRKLYAELAELWPDGWMDNIGIKHAVHRAKERKKKQSKLDNCREESRKRQKSSGGKQKMEELGTERALFLELSQDQILSEKTRGHDHLENEGNLISGCEVRPSSGEKRKYSRKSPFSSIETKRNKLEGSPLLRKKMRRKLEKGMIDTAPVVPKKSCSTHAAAQMSSSVKEMSPQSPHWTMGVQQGAVLPVTE